MEFSLDSYRMLARQCGAAHRIARDTGNAKAATGLFTTLWSRLDREDKLDHWVARQSFNAEFARAYRAGDNPPCDAPAPAPARPAPRAAVATDCAAFYAKQLA